MILAEEKYILNDKEVMLRSARLDEAHGGGSLTALPIMKTVTGETIDKTAIIQWIDV